MHFEQIKNYLLIILVFIVITLFYLILAGSFCHCSTITCPVNQPLRVYFA